MFVGRLRKIVPITGNGTKIFQRLCSSKPPIEQVHPDGLTRYPGFKSPNAILRTIDWIGRKDFFDTFDQLNCVEIS